MNALLDCICGLDLDGPGLHLAAASVMLLGGTWLILRLTRPRSAPQRRVVLLCALSVALVLPVAVAGFRFAHWGWEVAPEVPDPNSDRALNEEVTVDFTPPTRQVSGMPGLAERLGWDDGAGSGSPESEGPGAAAPGRLSPEDRGETSTRTFSSSSGGYRPVGRLALGIFTVVWAVGSLVLLLRLAFGAWRVSRYRHALPKADSRRDPEPPRLLRESARAVGLTRIPELRLSGAAGPPLTLGFFTPCIVIPLRLARVLDAADLRAVLTHECAHVVHGDFRVGYLQRVLAALFWWNPFAHVLNRDLSAAMEDLCDNYVMTAAAPPRRYAESLVTVAEHCLRPGPLPAAVALRPDARGLERRVKTLLSEERDMSVKCRRSLAAMLAIVFLIFAGLLGATRLGLAAEGPDLSGARVEESETVVRAVMLPDDPPAMEKVEPAAQEKEIMPLEEAQPENRIKATQKSVEWALRWLARHQDPEGYWDCDGYSAQCEKGKSPCPGKGQALNDVGVTGLAILAFLGSGNTPLVGPYKKNVRDGVKYLCDVQNSDDGCLTDKWGERYMYNHGIATLALTETYGLTNWAPIKKFAKRALEFIRTSKNPGKAWRYNLGEIDPIDQNDISVTGWMIMCLVSGQSFGLGNFEAELKTR